MAKRWRKQKAATQHAKRRKPKQGTGDASQASGTIGGLRSFTKGFFSGGKGKSKPKSTAARVVDVLLWAGVAAAAYFLVARQCMR